MDIKKIYIKELNLDLINPNTHNYRNPNQGGSKIVIIGKPNSGKSYLIKDILYKKKHIFSVGQAHSGSESSNKFYNSFFQKTFIFNELDKDAILNFKRRQKIAIDYLDNPWAVLCMDDCMDDPHIFKTPLFQAMFKNGRHWKALIIMALQYCMDIPPAMRICVDGTFIFREPNLQFRKKIYENFASIIPDFKMFCDIMDQITDDHTALYINNTSTSNNLEDCVFWYKAKKVPDDFQFGSEDFVKFHKQRFNPDYKSPI